MAGILTSSIGKKLLMSLAGLFLILFLPVHMGLNLTLILSDDPMTFNKAANFMASNKVIKVFEIVLIGGILLHIIYALIVQIQNWIARPRGYYKANKSDTSPFSKWMIHTAVIIFIFLVLHLMDFYFKVKLGGAPEVIVDGKHYHDMASMIIEKFHIPLYVVIYIVSFILLGFHLIHGFQSAFKTLGLNHSKYSPIISAMGIIYTIAIVGGFTSIPLVILLS